MGGYPWKYKPSSQSFVRGEPAVVAAESVNADLSKMQITQTTRLADLCPASATCMTKKFQSQVGSEGRATRL